MTAAGPSTPPPAQRPLARPLRVLVLRGADGTGGGADQIILRNAAQADPDRVEMTLCFLRHRDDTVFDFDRRCGELRLDYCEVLHRGPTDRSVLPQLLRIVQRCAPTIIHSHDYKASYFATKLARCTGVLRLATAHGWTGHSWRERMIYYPGDKLQLSRFPGVIAVSDEIRQTLIRWGAQPDRVRVLLNGIDPNAYRRDETLRDQIRRQLGFTPADCVLAAVGRVERQKRFDLLLDAVRLLRNEPRPIKLIIAGEGSLLNDLRRRVDRLRLNDCVVLLGHCVNMREVYSAFDVLIQSSDYEGTPTVVVEAMAMGIPVVATDVGGTRQLVTHDEHALLVPRRRPDLLALAVRRVWEDPAATSRRAQAARRRVETTLSFQQRIAKLQQAYEDLAGQGTLGPLAERHESQPAVD